MYVPRLLLPIDINVGQHRYCKSTKMRLTEASDETVLERVEKNLAPLGRVKIAK